MPDNGIKCRRTGAPASTGAAGKWPRTWFDLLRRPCGDSVAPCTDLVLPAISGFSTAVGSDFFYSISVTCEILGLSMKKMKIDC